MNERSMALAREVIENTESDNEKAKMQALFDQVPEAFGAPLTPPPGKS